MNNVFSALADYYFSMLSSCTHDPQLSPNPN